MALLSLLKGESGALAMRSRNPLTTAFYTIPSIHHQKDVPIQTLKPDSGSVRHVIMEPFYDVVPRHPFCPPPKERPHTSILHGATESSNEGVIMPDSRSVWHVITEPFYDGVLRHPIHPPPKGRLHTAIFHGAKESSEGGPDSGSVSYVITEPFNNGVLHYRIYLPPKPDSGSVRHVIIEPFYNVILHHPICPPPKGRTRMSILHGATKSSEGGLPGALGMRLQSPVRTVFYTIQAVHHQKGVCIR
ncbi:hypothetical protein B9Z19DRAFT_1129103 [Tuber borchii]|uniref:Uncharacterized protein n=1 Tax=Tuber borchii TaxID=42251 RepID=A0A2T6ZN07_TUBBO|nr:hypothetical protein B9Z19DRAFT_1129103 [Tuber borchii]